MAMQAANRLQQALKRGGATFGGWQMLPGTNLSRAIARSGVEWITVDCEHGNIDDAAMHEAVAAIAATGVSPVVRIPANEAWMVKRALDSGAHGIMVPLLETQAEAEQLAKSSKFPPVGNRGFGSPFPMGAFASASNAAGPSITEYLLNANAGLVTVVQIETAKALENVDGIASVPGIDVLLIGPFDLGNNIGHPILDGVTMAPALRAAIDRIQQAARAAGKATGIYCTSGEQARAFADRGFNMISVAADMIAIPAHFAKTLAVARGHDHSAALVSTAPKGPYGN